MIAENNPAYVEHLRLALEVLNESSNLGLDDRFAADLRKIIAKQISVSEMDSPAFDEHWMASE